MLFLALAFGTAVAWQNSASTMRGITVGVVAVLNLARTGYGLFHCLARPLRFLEVMTNGVGIIAAMLVYTHATHTAESKLRPIDGAAIAVIIFGLYMTMSAESHMGNADAPLVGAQLRLLSAHSTSVQKFCEFDVGTQDIAHTTHRLQLKNRDAR